jgi:hypothetical protein
MAKTKSSAQLPIGSLPWAEAKMDEDPEDNYALGIRLKHRLPNAPARCQNTGGTEKCRRRPERMSKCDLCGKRGGI